MFVRHTQFTSTRIAQILKAGEAAIRAIPPAFPLEATVAVNPFLGQTGEDLATASARLARVAGTPLTQDRQTLAAAIESGCITDEDLAGALAASPALAKPASVAALKKLAQAECEQPVALPTLAELAAEATGIDWPAVIEKSVGLWASGFFDQGQALWSPEPGARAFSAWRSWASRDLTPEIAGLKGFCEHVSTSPDTTERTILQAADNLGISDKAAETVFHRLLMDLGGWAQHGRWLLWQAELEGGTDGTLADLLAIRLIWEEALLTRFPEVQKRWQAIVTRHEQQIAATPDQIVNAILQEASERAFQRSLVQKLKPGKERQQRAAIQAAFCIDVRSEIYRRALENQSPTIETLGFAGFFGLPVAHQGRGSDVIENHLPVLLKPALTSTSHGSKDAEDKTRIGARAVRALGRFRQAAVSSFAFVEAAGPLYGWKLMRDAMGLGDSSKQDQTAPRLAPGLDATVKVETAAAVLRAMGLTKDLAPLVLLVGHTAQTCNNPHDSAYHCGACGGYSGEVSARLLADLLNDPETRAGLAEHDIEVPADTVFLAGLHNTTTDELTLFEQKSAVGKEDLAQLRVWLEHAGADVRAERALKLPNASARTIPARALNWAEIRPEWGLADCAAFVAAPRQVTSAADLEGRAFLHSYDWQNDEGFKTLELILTAPVVVASWISLQYYGSSVAPDIFGGGNKLIHNVVGGIGVVEGNGGRLRPGLPWQAVHDGEHLAHTPLRLTVLIEAPTEAIQSVLTRHPEVRALFDHGWLHLFALKEGCVSARYLAGGSWCPDMATERAA
ncbi:YbcC family protein [Labrenzia sp. VG12]|uniref:YbcC family protein n=1 Tax=Labrenzia sp. VG12 TaxID=2021862 RepID=UPI000B8C2D43|nr:DUF2309 domain-containing protein [Labrenzia sp. VG12]ASP34723.1 hypothetical protein CHH27_16980 [Labrenzia sp. VG12]